MFDVLYWLIALLAFGLLIFIHELGHYLTARACHVTIHEFSIGMGPKMVTYTSKKTGIKYSLGMLPIGGYVSMAGEDEESEDPNALCRKPAWQRFIIIVAGGLMNLLLGVLLIFALVLSSANLGSNRIHSYPEKAPYDISSADSGLLPGDTILAVNGTRVYIADDLAYEVVHDGGEGPLDLTVLRDGREMTLSVQFPTVEAGGIRAGALDFYVQAEEKSLGNVLKHTLHRSLSTVKMVWESLVDFIGGRYGMEAVSGPVGVAGAISDAASNGLSQLAYLMAVISINLGIFNLLPVPALDGGRLFFILIEIIFRRPVPQKYEALVHFIGILVLFGFVILVTFKDIMSFFA